MSTAGSAKGRKALLEAFTFRLVIFGYRDTKKDPRHVREYASLVLQPAGDGAPQSVSLATVLKSQDDGAFQLSQGVGVAVVAERTGVAAARLDPEAFAYIRIDSIELAFDPRPRNDDVTV
jgi:hypothetical protein